MAQIDRVTGLVGNLGVKAPCNVATTTAITLSGEQTIDGYACTAADNGGMGTRVLVKDQANPIENGIYYCNATAWQRAPDFDGDRDVAQGTRVFVVSGTANANIEFEITTPNPVNIGVSNLTIVQYLPLSGGAMTALSIHSATNKATPIDADEFGIWDSISGLLNKVNWANIKTTLLATWKDASGMLVGLTLYKINFKNAANTFTSFFTNANTAARTYTFQDKDGTIADLNDMATLRNVFINGDDSVNQVNNPTNAATGNAVTVTAGAAVASVIDRWYAASTGQNITAQQVTGPGQFKYALKLIAGATGPTTTLFGTRLEGKDCYRYANQQMNLQFGTFGDVARTITWTAYYANTLDTFSAKTQIATGTINATNAAAVYNIQFNAGANAANGICVEFATGALTNATGFQTYYGRQLEQIPAGNSQGTPFEFLPFVLQLERCERYLPVWNSTSTVSFIGSGGFVSTSAAALCIPLSTPTRVPVTAIAGPSVASPGQVTLTNTSAGATSVATAVAIGGASQASIRLVRLLITGTGVPYTANQTAEAYFNTSSGQFYGTGAELW